MKPIRILLADDHSLMRIGLAALFAAEKGLTVVGEADNGESAVSLARKLHPDIVIMDLSMPVLNGSKATKTLKTECPDVHVLILTSYGTSQDLVDAIRNGADGALLKDTPADDLVTAVRDIVAGERVIPETISAFLAENQENKKLTERQTAVLQSVANGFSDREIALQFDMTVAGAKRHMRNIFAKIGATNRTEAAAIALRKHLLKI